MFLFSRLQRIDCAGIYCAACPSITVWPGVGGAQVEVGDAAGARRGWGALGADGDLSHPIICWLGVPANKKSSRVQGLSVLQLFLVLRTLSRLRNPAAGDDAADPCSR